MTEPQMFLVKTEFPKFNLPTAYQLIIEKEGFCTEFLRISETQFKHLSSMGVAPKTT